MKALFPSILLILFLETTQGQTTAQGFYINLNNDTVHTIFRMPQKLPNTLVGVFHSWSNLESIYQWIEIVDSTKQSKILKPSEATFISFHYNSKNYQFYSKPISESEKGFLTKEAFGSKASLFQYIQTKGGGKDAFGNTESPYEVFYWTIEKMDGTYLFIRSSMPGKSARKMLLAFFSDSPETQAFINKKFDEKGRMSLQTIESILATYNSL